MALATYADLQTQVGNWLARSDLASFMPDWITLFEAYANRNLRVRNMENRTVLVPSNPTALTVTGAANNGSGLIRLTVPTSTLSTGNEVVVAGVQGTSEANGSWIITVIDATHLDLQGSTFTNAYTSGGTVTAFSFAALPSDYLEVRSVIWTGSPRQELEYLHPDEFYTLYNTLPQDNSVSEYYTIEGANLYVMPSNGTPLEFDYFQKIPALSGSVNWLYSNWPDAYLFGTLVEAGAFIMDPEKTAFWATRRDRVFDEIRLLNFRSGSNLAIHPMGPVW